MNRCAPLLLSALLACGAPPESTTAPSSTPTEAPSTMPEFHTLAATTIDGKPFPFEQLKGRKVIIVNTASECGYTPQYAELQELYAAHKDRGLVVLGFPSNDFGGQEPGAEAEIAAFCAKNYGVSFPLMSKVRTTGAEQHPVYAWLTHSDRNGVLNTEVKWNFHKFLIDEQGVLQKDLPSSVSPLDPAVLAWVEG
ncbi:MAG: glutathione peroxidase [Flavobacteriales bacterium]|jgi:glutathione peroxidase|nr:glutathione peroxidase [Flavobacteriales bacterium]MBK7941046.1 glutathione peroxidase [Flavobacteriales bacterium]